MKKDNYMSVILEEVRDKFKQIREAQDDLKGLPQQVKEINNRLIEVEREVKVTRLAVTDLSREAKSNSKQLRNHEERITTLEHV